MINIISKLKRFWLILKGYFPSRLPIGMTEFDNWYQSIVAAYGFPDNDSIKFSVAVMVLHLDSTTAYKPKRYFARSILKAMSNQIVSQVVQDLKAKQQAQQQAEATAKLVPVASDAKQQ